MNGIGFIYKISSNKGDKVYVGQTTEGLNQRFARHKSCFKDVKRPNATKCTILFHEYGIENCNIELLESVSYTEETINILGEREDHWIKTIPNTVNVKRNTPFTEERAKESKRAYYEKNKDTEEYKKRAHEISVRYMGSHREEQREKARKYREENPEKIEENNKIQYQKIKQNQERYQARMARILEWVTCECGTRVQRGNLSRHKKSNVHQSFLKK